MDQTTPLTSSCLELDADSADFYRRVMEVLQAADFPFLVGGAYAQSCYTGSQRTTKDLDLFIRRRDFERLADVMAQAGYAAEMTYPHWLAKIRQGEAFIDIIFCSGNGVSEVDDEWFEHAADAEVLGVPVKISPVEEMLWSKAFVMERERFDGADVAHLLHARGERLDWPRLLRRFDANWRVLLSHLVLFGFIYPDRQSVVPRWVMQFLLDRLATQPQDAQAKTPLCRGTLLSREQYLQDVEQQGYRDSRLRPDGNMSRHEIARWTDAIPERHAMDADVPE